MAKAKKPRGLSARKATARKRPSKKAATELDRLRHFIRTRSAEYLKDPNVTSVGIGERQGGGYCLRFTVKEKVGPTDRERLEELATNLLPSMIEVDGMQIPTEVEERTFKAKFDRVKLEAKDPRKLRLDPIMPGISVSHPKGTAGTIGAIVYDLHGGDPCILSNWHVLETPDGKLGDAIVQPGPFDDNRTDLNQVGVLVRSHLGPAGDCAIARIEGRGFRTDERDLGVSVEELGKPQLGDIVTKSGRTTEVTRGRVRRIDVMSKINYGGDVGEQLIGGFEIGPLPTGGPDYEVSMGGDSGSAWMAVGADGKPTGVMLGLHFAGEGEEEADEHALACYASSVFEKLEISPTPPTKPHPEATGTGYNEEFLAERVRLPALGKKTGDAVRVQNSTSIPYTHFSVCLSRSRHLALFVAWNIDGASLKAYGRKGLKFRRDHRVPDELQVGDELYADNKLDRGHIARRADVVWGPPAEAKRANADSFFFTNITPQHQRFNQSDRGGLWGQLENAILEDVDVENLRVSVIAGPVLQPKDPEYRGVRLPRSFWKLVCYVDAEDGALKAKAYVLTQRNLLNDLEALDLDEFRLYQVSVEKLETTTGLDFGAAVRHADASWTPEGVRPEGLARGVREVTSRDDLL